MPEAERRRRAPPSQIQITFTLRAKDQFSKERGRKRRRRPRGRASGGSGERRALERGGPGAPGGSGSAGQGCRGSGGGRRRAAPGRGQGGRNGRPPGHVTRPGPRRPPSLTTALPRPGGGPGVMPALGDAELGPARARGATPPGEAGLGVHARSRAPEGPSQGLRSPPGPGQPSLLRCAHGTGRGAGTTPAPWSPRPPAAARK
ncbi:ribosomal large subunit pseudouridine synthase B-like [Mesocricetus auratus]|uniref:Ribosomal large subunit pseudouridine synthase B-like n=1 Tax=Mesocricetus auratus TaxID=10036 RepID=A0ABM2XIN9_MESAU|nr:ribosomal large subunit pseudouridine synthase B-like [Mesocricetus auratus]